jgi:REP-associated tyrosine transposase
VLLPCPLHLLLPRFLGAGLHLSQLSHFRGPAQFSRGLHLTERVSASRSRKCERGIWQRRFWEHTIRDNGDFARHMDYIHFNPVKHSYVERVQDWPFSSFHRMVRLGCYPPEWAGRPGDEPHSGFGER